MDFDFLVDTYETERLKTLGVWAQFAPDDLELRPEPRARTPREQMVHQCVSEEGWMTKMLGLDVGWPVLPSSETRDGFLEHYGEASARRINELRRQTEEWFRGEAKFFDVSRSRAWVLTRRIAHTAHHRGQLTVYLRLLGQPLYSTYGPTADTGGLPAHGAKVIYPFTGDQLSMATAGRDAFPPLPGVGAKSPTERRST